MTPDTAAQGYSINRYASTSEAGTRQSSWLETAFASFAFISYGGAIVSPLRILRGAGPLQVGVSDPFVAASQAIILSVLICVTIKRWRRMLPLLKLAMPCLLILALCLLSVLWSDYPFVTLRRSTNLGVCILFGVYCYDAFGPRALINIVLRVTILLAVLSLLVYAAAPDIGHEPTVAVYANAMRGVFSQKNGMAEFMLLGITCCCYRVIETRRIGTFILTILLLYGCILLGRSMSSLLIAPLLLVVTIRILLRETPKARLVFSYVVMSAVAVAIAALCLVPNQILDILGRDGSLTGRLPLWQIVVQSISERPLLGYGYSGFWNADSINMQYLWLRAGWPAPDAHNGYLDILLQIGIAGLILYFWLWARIIYLARKAWRTEAQPFAAWILLFMLINVLVNVDEGPLPFADQFTAMVPPALLAMELWNARKRRETASIAPARGLPDIDLIAIRVPLRAAARTASKMPVPFDPLSGIGRQKGSNNGR